MSRCTIHVSSCSDSLKRLSGEHAAAVVGMITTEPTATYHGHARSASEQPSSPDVYGNRIIKCTGPPPFSPTRPSSVDPACLFAVQLWHSLFSGTAQSISRVHTSRQHIKRTIFTYCCRRVFEPANAADIRCVYAKRSGVVAFDGATPPVCIDLEMKCILPRVSYIITWGHSGPNRARCTSSKTRGPLGWPGER